MGLDTKYRPKSFDDVIGQDVAIAILRATVEKNMYGSAYCLSGPSGVGKTTISRIFAKSILCDNHVKGNPCGDCESCRLFDEERNFGYIELDAASVGGKEDMVKLKDEAVFISTEKKKIIYLDECHDISKQGQDALLKQVEQCPPHLIYLFSTTEPEKLKPTLLKRCTHFHFSRVLSDQIFKRLKVICDTEKLSYDDDALKIIAERSNGHVRDALKILEEITYFGPINAETVSKVVVDFNSQIFEILANLGSNLPRTLDLCKNVSNFLSVWEFYGQLLEMVTDAVKLIYGYKDFLPKRREMLERLQSIHGCNLIEFMNYLLSREKLIDRIGLTSDIILLHYKFCTNGFKPQVPVEKIQEAPMLVQTPATEPAPSSAGISHNQIMAMPLAERQRALRASRTGDKMIQEKEDSPKIPFTWSLPKEERHGVDSSDINQQELSPIEFSRMLVGGRGIDTP